MKGKRIFFRLFVLFLLGSAVPCSAYVFSIVVDRKKADYDKTISAIEQAVKEGHEIKLFELNKNDMSNPIQRGQFLSQIAAGDLVVTIGDRASEFITGELDQSNIFFVGAGHLSDSAMSSSRIFGIMQYSQSETVQVIRKLFPRSTHIGVMHTAAYSKLLTTLRKEASAFDFTVVDNVVRANKDVGPAAREILDQSDVLWMMGGDMIMNDLALNHTLTQALVRLRPIVVPSVRKVRQGGLFCMMPDYAKLGEQAANTIKSMITDSLKVPERRIGFCVPTSMIAMNKRLAGKMNVEIPEHMKVIWID